MSSRAAFMPLAFLAVVSLGAECEENPETDPIHIVDRSMIPPQDDVWASSPWEVTNPEFEGLIEIEPGTRIQLFHALGRSPIEVHAYVGFAEEGSRVMPASGNASEIHEVGYEEGCPYDACDYVIIRNGSGGSFYYRFVLR